MQDEIVIDHDINRDEKPLIENRRENVRSKLIFWLMVGWLLTIILSFVSILCKALDNDQRSLVILLVNNVTSTLTVGLVFYFKEK